MKKRRLGSSNLMVSELGLGCMSIGTDEGYASRIIEAALEEGINYFDTADLYDFGMNEKIIGQSLNKMRDSVIIATKVGNRWNERSDGWTWDASKAYIKEAVKHSLKRLGIDYIDLYQLHGGTIEDRIEETIEAFEELTAEGLIRYYGISSIRPNVIRKYADVSNIVSVMMQYSILDRRPEEEALPLLHQKGISVVTRGSVAKGLLSDNWFEKLSRSFKESRYLNYHYEDLMSLLPSLKEKLAQDRSFIEVALRYNLSHPAVASVIVGASSVAQLRENARAVTSTPLTESEIALIQALTTQNVYEQHR